jgi:hypothetical protein
MSSLADALSAGPKPRPRQCVLAKAIVGHEDEAAILAALSDSETWPSHNALAAVLTAHGIDATKDRVGAHRRGSCGCTRG